MLAERAYSMGASLELHLVTPEAAPLEVFGPEAAREVAELLAEAGISVHTDAHAEILGPGRLRLAPTAKTLEVERIVTLPRLEGPAVAGLPVRRRRLPGHGRARPRARRAGRLRRRRHHRLPDQAGRHRLPAGRRRRGAHRRPRGRPDRPGAVHARAARHAAAPNAGRGSCAATASRRRDRGGPRRCGGRRPRSPDASSPATSRASTRRPAASTACPSSTRRTPTRPPSKS